MSDNRTPFPPIGSSFQYLGREMVVTSHKEFVGIGFVEPIFANKLVCEYADNEGVIREKTFWPQEVEALNVTR